MVAANREEHPKPQDVGGDDLYEYCYLPGLPLLLECYKFFKVSFLKFNLEKIELTCVHLNYIYTDPTFK